MAREAFKATPGDRRNMVQLPPSADALPDKVVVDLDDKNPDNFKVVVVDDTPEADRGREKTWNGPSAADEEDLRDVSAKVQKRIDRLRAETHTERRTREAAERERDAAIELTRSQQAEIERLRQATENGTRATAQAMAAERETRISDAKRRLEQAHADGDNAAIATATADLSQAQAELVAIRTRTPPAAKPATEQPKTQVQPAAPRLVPKVKEWVDYHRDWWQKDKAKTNQALSIHHALAAEGITPSSPEYTREVDRRLRSVYPDHRPMETLDDTGGSGDERPRRTNAVDQGGREGRVGQPSNPRQVELTQSEVSLANRMRVPLVKYAEEKARRMAKEGSA